VDPVKQKQNERGLELLLRVSLFLRSRRHRRGEVIKMHLSVLGCAFEVTYVYNGFLTRVLGEVMQPT
jgi:hypothetical protein